MRIFLLNILIFSFVISVSIPAFAKPVLLISHPSEGFMRSILYLQENGIMTETDFIFLIHEKEKVLKHKLLKLLKKRKIHKYRLHILENINQDIFKPDKSVKSRYYPETTQYRPELENVIPHQWEYVFSKIFRESDGYIIPGGLAIPALMYGEKSSIFNKSGASLRAFYESAFLRFIFKDKNRIMKTKPDYLIFGICYGCQLLNISLEGKLYQSISHEIYRERFMEDSVTKGFDHLHKNTYKFLYPETEYIYPGWFHKVRFNKKTSDFFTPLENVMVLSNHKQAIKNTGVDLCITGTSIDGKIPEFIQNIRFRNVFGIQSHPERKYLWDRMKNLSRETMIFHRNLWNRISKVLVENYNRRK